MSDAIAVRGKDTPVTALNALLLRNQKQIELALPKHLRPERLIRLAVTALNTSPTLQNCSLLTIANSVMLAAQLGLEINNGLGHGWLIPYKQVCTFQPGYRGFLDLAYRTKRIRDSRAVMVYQNERFQYEEGAKPVFTHEPKDPKHRGEDWIGAYSRLSHTDGFESVFWMWKEEILDIRDKCSRAAEKTIDKWGNPIVPIWVKWFDEMVKKTVIKRHLKMAQLSGDIALAVGIDDQAEGYAAKEESPKTRTEPVQDLILDQSLIDDALEADDALQAGTREEVREVAQQVIARAAAKAKPAVDEIDWIKSLLVEVMKAGCFMDSDRDEINKWLGTYPSIAAVKKKLKDRQELVAAWQKETKAENQDADVPGSASSQEAF